MGTLRFKSTVYNYKEQKRKTKTQFINGTSDQLLTAKITKELTTVKDSSDVAGEQVLS